MSEIDWDKAPEGATHYHPVNHYFYKYENGILQSFIFDAWGESGLISVYHNSLIKRPPPSWNGAGLPPVGVVCEANFVGEWRRFELRYYGEAYVVFKTAFEVQRTRHDFDTCGVKFRPIRTPEQIAEDDRTHEIRNALTSISHKVEKVNTDIDCSLAIAETVSAMIDAGYRKP